MTNDLDPGDRSFAESARRALRESEHLDAVSAARLAAGRRRALARAFGRNAAPWRWAAGFALAATVLLAVILPRLQPQAPYDPADTDTLEIVTDELGPDFYEDLDFYQALDDASDGI
jgi:hypothetical protein